MGEGNLTKEERSHMHYIRERLSRARVYLLERSDKFPLHARGLAVSELAGAAVGAEPDRVVVDVLVQLPPFSVGGKPHVAALGAGGCQGNLGLHADESMSNYAAV